MFYSPLCNVGQGCRWCFLNLSCCSENSSDRNSSFCCFTSKCWFKANTSCGDKPSSSIFGHHRIHRIHHHHHIIEHLNLFLLNRISFKGLQTNPKQHQNKLISKFLSAKSPQSNIIARRPTESNILMNWMAVLHQLVVTLVSLVQLVPSVHL